MLSTWPTLDIRIQDLAITPDKGRLVAIGYHASSTPNENPSTPLTHAILLQASAGTHPPVIAGIGNSNEMERRIIVYDSLTKQEIWWECFKFNSALVNDCFIQVSNAMGRTSECQDLWGFSFCPGQSRRRGMYLRSPFLLIGFTSLPGRNVMGLRRSATSSKILRET